MSSHSQESSSAARPRVLLVDDDAAIRRLVELALEDLPVAVETCPDAAAARRALAARPAALVIADLMMPGEPGLDLLASLAAGGAGADATIGPGAAPRLVAFSAGLTPATRARLESIGVRWMLDKPVSIAALERCVIDALGLAPAAAAAAPPAVAGPGDALDASAGAPSGIALPPAQRQALLENFDGDLALFLAFRAEARRQFAADLDLLARTLAAADWPALRRTAHSLKGALATLGEHAAADAARALEQAAAAADPSACAARHAELRHCMPELDARSDTFNDPGSPKVSVLANRD